VTVKSYGDCEHVVTPADKDNIAIVLQGVVNVISDERIYKQIVKEIKLARRKRERDAKA